MKRILILVTIIGVGGLLAYNVVQGNKKVEYVADTASSIIEEIVVVEEESYPDKVLQDAQDAQNAVLRAYELEQDRMSIVEEMAAKKAEYDLYIAEQNEAITSIDKELKTY